MGPTNALPIVALVCSAGGLDALASVLGRTPVDTVAAFVVVQHQVPDAPSGLLADVLRRQTGLDVAVAADGDVLRAGHVVVGPPGHHLLIDHATRVRLIVSGAVPPARPSADLLLTTLALAAGPRAIAVVLSGHGRDGATGATAIHRFGGTVIASDAATSEVFAMPHETIERRGVVDHVVSVDDIAALLTRLTA